MHIVAGVPGSIHNLTLFRERPEQQGRMDAQQGIDPKDTEVRVRATSRDPEYGPRQDLRLIVGESRFSLSVAN
jgi:hypothetical protein